MVERLAPVDEYGVPLAIHPYDPPKGMPQSRREDGSLWEDEDHGFYCHSAPELTGSEGGKALRVSMAQTTGRWLHSNKHRAYPDGLERYPQTEAEQFGTLVLIAGGYFSRIAVDYRDADNPRQVTMTKRTYATLRNANTIHIVRHSDSREKTKSPHYSFDKIGKFFASYAKSQDLSLLNESTIDCFLHTEDLKQKHKMGRTIIFHAIDHATDPLNPSYAKAFEEGLVIPKLITARDVVMQYFHKNKWPDYFNAFEQEIKAQLGLTNPPKPRIITPVTN